MFEYLDWFDLATIVTAGAGFLTQAYCYWHFYSAHRQAVEKDQSRYSTERIQMMARNDVACRFGSNLPPTENNHELETIIRLSDAQRERLKILGEK